MNTQYTMQQVIEFSTFILRHNIEFNNLDEYRAALDQYFED